MSQLPPKPKDKLHSRIVTNCLSCHSISKWKPATFEHSLYFVLDQDHNTDCIVCHKNNNFETYTCYGCHEHTPSILLQNTGKKASLILINVSDVIKVPTKTTSVMKADQRKRITEKTIINGNPAIQFSKHKIFTQSLIVKIFLFSDFYVITI